MRISKPFICGGAFLGMLSLLSCGSSPSTGRPSNQISPEEREIIRERFFDEGAKKSEPPKLPDLSPEVTPSRRLGGTKEYENSTPLKSYLFGKQPSELRPAEPLTSPANPEPAGELSSKQ
jgi:hypothetical protein